jgi:hypothetical protein
MTRRRALAVGSVLVTLSVVAAAYAQSTGEFLPRGEKWANGVCRGSLLKSPLTLENNEKIALCYSFLRVKEDNATVASLTAQSAALETGVAGLKTATANLEKEVAALKEGHGAPTQDFTFFTNELSETSPTFDAKSFTHVLFSSSCGPPGAEIFIRVETSPDESHWAVQTKFKCGSEPPPQPLPTAGRYYRLIAEEPLGLSSLFVMGQFSS